MSSIRAARNSDAATLSALAASTFTETFGRLYRPEDLRSFLQKSHSVGAYGALLADPAFALWIAETDAGAAVGYCVAGPCSLPAPDLPAHSGELARLYVANGEQGSGLGARLLETALAWLDARYLHVYLSVYAENFRAQRLYAKYGFVKIRDYFYMVGEHADPEWIMKRVK